MEIYNRSKRHDVRNVRSTYKRRCAEGVSKAFPVKKVTSSRGKKQTVVLSETELDTAALAETIRGTGYEVGEIQKEPYTKKGLFG